MMERTQAEKRFRIGHRRFQQSKNTFLLPFEVSAIEMWEPDELWCGKVQSEMLIVGTFPQRRRRYVALLPTMPSVSHF
jgi:hypothetical protein